MKRVPFFFLGGGSRETQSESRDPYWGTTLRKAHPHGKGRGREGVLVYHLEHGVYAQVRVGVAESFAGQSSGTALPAHKNTKRLLNTLRSALHAEGFFSFWELCETPGKDRARA